MKESRFIEKNESDWKALESYNNRLLKENGIRRLAAEEVREFARLFRLAGHHLAYAKTHYPTGKALPYLNKIAGVSHNFFYVREKSGFSGIKEYFTRVFPNAVRETETYWIIAAAFFALGMLFAAFYVGENPHRLGDILPAGMAEGFMAGEVPDFGDGGVDWDNPLMTAVIMTNNITVAFNAFAFGLIAGLGTLYVMIYNGLVVGGLFGFLHQSGADMVTAYALVLPHGVLELMAIFLCGGAGLMIGKGIVIPGDYTRRHSLVIHAKKAAELLPGVVIMLVIAAVIEGFFTPLPISPMAKLVFAAITGVGFFVYCYKKERKQGMYYYDTALTEDEWDDEIY